MPYITEEARSDLRTREPKNAGELNYLITSLCINYLLFNGSNYARFNDVVGALECAKLEMYRRKISPYEDRKIKENGDVYPQPVYPKESVCHFTNTCAPTVEGSSNSC